MKDFGPPAMVEVRCKCCRNLFQARVADRKRGWGRFCSKSCKAIKQEQRTGQHAAYVKRKDHVGHSGYEATDDGMESPGWDAHKEWTN